MVPLERLQGRSALPQIASCPACFVASSPTAWPYANLAAPAATLAAVEAVDAGEPTTPDAVELRPVEPVPDEVERAFAQPSSIHGTMIVSFRTSELNIVQYLPLFELSLRGSMCVDSMIPGRPSTTPAVCLKFRCASRCPVKLEAAPAPVASVVGSVTYTQPSLSACYYKTKMK